MGLVDALCAEDRVTLTITTRMSTFVLHLV